MNPVHAARHVRRIQLLGGAGIALAAALVATSAQAQTAPLSGNKVVSNDQSVAGGIYRADVEDGSIEQRISGPVDDSTIALRDNAIAATARLNRVAQDIASTENGPAASPSAALRAGTQPGGQAELLIANRQDGGTADLNADIFDTRVSVEAEDVAGSRLAASGNALESVARNNESVAVIDSSASAPGSAGIVSVQSVTGSSAARANLGVELVTGTVAGSTLDLSTNREMTGAQANWSDNRLAVSSSGLFVPLSSSVASTVPSGAGDPEVNALFGILSSQSSSSVVRSVAGDADNLGPAFHVSADGDVGSSSITADGNALSGAAAANRGGSTLSLEAASIAAQAPGGPGNGAVANLSSVQRSPLGLVSAIAIDGTAIDVAGSVSAAQLSASGGTLEVTATGNLVTANRLTVSAGTVDALRGGAPATLSAGTSASGDAITEAAFGLQNVQDYGSTRVIGSRIGKAATIAVSGAISGTDLSADGNSALASATGNRATNGAALEATSLAASAGLDNVQRGNGNVTARIGTELAPDGALITPDGPVSTSRLSISSNSFAGSAIGSSAVNSMTVDAASLASDGHAAARSGDLGTDQGADAQFALASSQTLATGSVPATAIASEVYARSGLGTGVQLTDSTLAIEDNSHAASAVGNTMLNRLSVAAATTERGAGAALAAEQSAQAEVAATTIAGLGTSGAFEGSSVRIAGNSVLALGVLNDADNAVSFDAGNLTGTTPAGATASISAAGSAFASGNAMLTSHQLASGEARADSTLAIGNMASVAGLSDSRLTFADNSNAAEASGNRTRNAVSASSLADTPGIGIASAQDNAAQVSAAATTVAQYVPFSGTGVDAGSAILIEGNSSSALARGNAAENLATLGGASTAGAALASTGAGGTTDEGAIVVANSQVNTGAISAFVTGPGYLPLNAGTASVAGSSLTASGNSIASSAYGNVASNLVIQAGAGQLPGAAIANLQVNQGTVTSQVSGTGLLTNTGPASNAMFSTTGNSLLATATGNQASSSIATPR